MVLLGSPDRTQTGNHSPRSKDDGVLGGVSCESNGSVPTRQWVSTTIKRKGIPYMACRWNWERMGLVTRRTIWRTFWDGLSVAYPACRVMPAARRDATYGDAGYPIFRVPISSGYLMILFICRFSSRLTPLISFSASVTQRLVYRFIWFHSLKLPFLTHLT